MAFEFTKGTERSYNCAEITASMKTGGNAENRRSRVASAHGDRRTDSRKSRHREELCFAYKR